jgi:hypothetical protein
MSLAHVTTLLGSRAGNRRRSRASQGLASTQEYEYEDEETRYTGLVLTEATSIWREGAIEWIIQRDVVLCPTLFSGIPTTLPSTIPHDCFNPNQDYPAHPSFGNCFLQVALLIQQVKEGDFLYEQLFAWLHLMPILLLRAPGATNAKALSSTISKRCAQFLRGEWGQLYEQARKDSEKAISRINRNNSTNHVSPAARRGKIQQAIKCIRRGNLSKGARILSGNGTSKDPDAHNEMVAKHPQTSQHAQFPADFVLEPIEDLEIDHYELERHFSTANLARVASSFPAESHPDQWGWRTREYIAPLLHAPGVGEILVEVLLRPRREGTILEHNGKCYKGGKLIALSKAPKPGSRPITIGDAFRRITDKALHPFSRKDLTRMCENTYSNVKQFASGSSNGAEKFMITALLALQEDPAPAEAVQTPDEDPMVIIQLDATNAFNMEFCQVIFDMITRQYETSYAKGRLTAENTTKLPASFAVHIPSRAPTRDVFSEANSSTLETFPL